MPLFFIMSGFCFKESYLSSSESRKLFIRRRIKGLYIPYVKWSLIFLLFHNVFLHLNIYNGTYGWKGDVSRNYVFSDYLYNIPRILGMLGNEQLLGGYWFLTTLFHSSILFLMSRIWLSNKHVLFIYSLLSIILYQFKNELPLGQILALDAIGVVFFSVGRIFVYYEKYLYKNRLQTAVVCLLIVFLGSLLFPSSLSGLRGWIVLPYVFVACCGTIMTYAISNYPPHSAHYVRRLLIFAGDNSIAILTWHFLCFKIVSYIIILLYDLPIENLAQFPRISEYSEKGWWILYSFVGVCVPLGWQYLLKSLRADTI